MNEFWISIRWAALVAAILVHGWWTAPARFQLVHMRENLSQRLDRLTGKVTMIYCTPGCQEFKNDEWHVQ